jgi:hypothetical protein
MNHTIEVHDMSNTTWTVTQTVPNTKGVLVGRERNARPFITITHDATSCADALAIMARLEEESGRKLSTQLRCDGEPLMPYRTKAWGEYQAAIASKGVIQQ